jgi:hypothetical protein
VPPPRALNLRYVPPPRALNLRYVPPPRALNLRYVPPPRAFEPALHPRPARCVSALHPHPARWPYVASAPRALAVRCVRAPKTREAGLQAGARARSPQGEHAGRTSRPVAGAANPARLRSDAGGGRARGVGAGPCCARVRYRAVAFRRRERWISTRLRRSRGGGSGLPGAFWWRGSDRTGTVLRGAGVGRGRR